MNVKRITAVIILFVFALNILTACNSNKEIFSKVQWTNAYKTQYLETPDEYTAHTAYFKDDKIYITFSKRENLNTEHIEIVNDNILYIYGINGNIIEIKDLKFGNFKDIPFYFVPSNDGAFYIMDAIKIQKIANDGALIWELNFEEAFSIKAGWSSSTTYSICYDENYLYILSTMSVSNLILPIVYMLTHSGKPVQKLEIGQRATKLFTSHNGEILLQCNNGQNLYGQNLYNYYVVNMKSEKLEEYKIPKLPETFTTNNSIYNDIYYDSSFAVEYEIYYKDDYGLYGYNPGIKEPDLLINWTNSDLLGQYCTVLSIITPDIVLCELDNIYSQSRRTSNSLALLIRIPNDELSQKTILTIASVHSISNVTLKQAVVMFNKQSEKYRLVIDDYSIYNTTDDITRSNTLFNLDVVSGVVHDIVFINPLASIPLDNYIKKGMFADLYEFFDKDPDISRNYLLGCIRRNNETDGRLYMIPSYFTIYTLVSKPSLLGANENLTIDEIIKLNENLPPDTTLFTNCGRSDVLQLVLFAEADKYIDYKNAKCNFTDDSFIKMIEFVKTLPDNIGNGWYFVDGADNETIEKIRNDTSYLFEYAFNNIKSFINLKYIYGDVDYVIKGYPNQTGNGSIINNFDFVTINSKSENKEGAWEFIKFYLSDEIQLYQTTLPITNSALSYMLDDYLSKYFYTIKNNISKGAIQILDEPIEEWRRDAFNDFHFTEADAAEIKRFLNDVPVVPKYDNTVFEIIYEEIDTFFNGTITAEQCAKYIQNRVSTYLNEQK